MRAAGDVIGVDVPSRRIAAPARVSVAFRRLARARPPWARAIAVAYAVPVAAATIVAATWFRPGAFIASGDVTPFIRDNLAREWLSPWGHQATGAGSSSYEMARALEIFAAALADLVGAPDAFGEFLLLGACFAAAAFGGAHVARAFTTHPVAIAAAGLVAAFNPFTLVNHPNPLQGLTIGLTGALVGQVWRRGNGERVSALGLAALTLPASYIAVNPPLLAVVLASVALAAASGTLLFGSGATRRSAALVASAAPVALLLNLWWVVPFVQMTLSGAGATFSAETDVQAWAWSHVRNSIANVATLNAHWGWTQPDYYPYAARMDGGAWQVVRWVLPGAALAGVLLAPRGRRRAVVALAVVAATLIFLSKGLHPPFGSANAWLYEHVPAFWLLREPASKLGVALVLVYAVLLALAVARGTELVRNRRRSARVATSAACLLVVGAAAAYPWPLWTGHVVPSDRGALPGSHVRVPSEWHSAASAVNASPVRGKALVLPLGGYYQVTTSWGYHGADAVPQQLLRRPVVQSLPGGYFGNAVSFEELVRSVEDSLRAGDAAHARRLLTALGVSHVIVRRDVVPDTQTPSYAPPDRLAGAMARIADARRLFTSPLVDVFEITGAQGLVTTRGELVAVGGARVAASVGALPPNAVAATDASAPVDSVRWAVTERSARSSFDLARGGRYGIGRPDAGVAVHRVAVERGRSGAVLSIADTVRIAVDDAPVDAPDPLRVALSSPDVRALEAGGRLHALDRSDAFLTFDPGAPVTAFGRATTASGLGSFSPVEDCNAHDARTPREAGLALDRRGRVLRLSARAHSACTWAALPHAPAGAVELMLEFRVVRGADARLCVWNDARGRCLPIPALPSGDGWQPYRAVLPSAADPLRLYLYADGDIEGGTAIEYRDVRAFALEEIGASDGHTSASDAAGSTFLARGPHELSVTQDVPAHPLGAISGLEDCGASDSRTPAEAGLALTRLGGGAFELAAGAHIACVWTSAGPPERGAAYRVAFEHRTLAGRPARFCVWQVSAERCADVAAVAPSGEWASFSAIFEPDPAATELRLYLYADGQADPKTRVQYRELVLEPVVAATVAVEPAERAAAAAPRVEWREEHPARYHADVRGASGAFVLVLAESFARGWSLAGLPEGWSAEHVEVDGYANGWRIQGSGDASLTLTYAPARVARLAALTSAATLLALALLFAARLLRRRGVRVDRILPRRARPAE